jgi:hypothetical protein
MIRADYRRIASNATATRNAAASDGRFLGLVLEREPDHVGLRNEIEVAQVLSVNGSR